MTGHQSKKLINLWLRSNEQLPIAMKLPYVEFASELSQRMFKRHAWRHFEDNAEAVRFVRSVAKALNLETLP
jgi:hypothetical protein